MKRPFSFLSRSPRAPQAEAPADNDRPRPKVPVYIVGDLHGRADLLEPLFARVDADIGEIGARHPQLVFIGDYIDHGPSSLQVLDRLMSLTAEFPRNVTCLMGSHERMLLDFLADPVHRGGRWLRAGGGETLKSFGLAAPEPGAAPQALAWLARDLAAAMPEDMFDWLAALPLTWHSGNLWVVHAGADPLQPMERQSARVLLWGHPEFDVLPRGDGIWVAHGHTEIAAPLARDGRINVDTAAWRTGRLSACAIRPDGGHLFLSSGV